jgi:triacylglycerol esterase/lipase EstA (alpha/beta hydrolase family)
MRIPRSLLGILGLAAAGAVAVTAVTSAAGAATPPPPRPLPIGHNALANFIVGLGTPTQSPPGANVPCTLSPAHPYPVVIVPGTFETDFGDWQALSPLLKNNGYCVYGLNYGAFQGLNSAARVADSAKELATFIDRVRQITGAPKVDIVGHSQGGMMPRYYINFLGGDRYVDKLIGISPSSHGTTVAGIATLVDRLGLNPAVALASPAVADQFDGSAFLKKLDASGDTRPGVAYTVISTRYDEVVSPWQSQFLTAGPGATVHNILIQVGCEADLSEHIATPYDIRVLTYVLNDLDPAHQRPVPCVPSLPLIGN